MRNLVSMVLAGMIVLSGCIPCLHPIYTDKDVTFDSKLIGVWSYPDAKPAPDKKPPSKGKEYWKFSKLGENSYRLLIAESDGKVGVFETHLVKIDDAMFLDLYPIRPDKPAAKNSDFYMLHLLSVHSFMAVDRIGDVLRYRFMDADWLNKYLDKNPQELQHEKLKGSGPDIVITASTKEIQSFLAKHVKTENAFMEWKELKRRNHKP